jgi:hypothetical protein
MIFSDVAIVPSATPNVMPRFAAMFGTSSR